MSCTAAADCTAAGYDGGNEAMAVSESGGVWGTPVVWPTAFETGLNAGVDFDGVSCAAAGDCTAVGVVAFGNPFSAKQESPAYATESNGTWGRSL